jgi:molybdate transport system substrate-binding protein
LIRRTYIKSNWNSGVRSTATWLALAVLAGFASDSVEANEIRVFAAASTTKPLSDILKLYEQQTAINATPVFAASGALARQIDQGAPADIFLSANPKWMDWLEKRKRLINGTRRNLIGNCLVLIQPQAEPALPPLSQEFARSFKTKRFVFGDPAYVPAGEYAMAALKRLKLWSVIESRAARMPSVRHVLFLIERHEADAGLVYRSDALSNVRVHIAEKIDPNFHGDIVYPVAMIERPNTSRATRQLYDFLNTTAALTIFEQHGFRLLDKTCSD